MNDIIGQHRRENASYSSKNWIAWCWNNWRKGKRGPRECEAAWDQRVFHSVCVLSSLFFDSVKVLSYHHFLFPESTLQSSLIPRSPPVSSVLSSPHPTPQLLRVCGPEGWIRMSDRKRSHFLTSLLPLPFAHFLELHVVLYSAQSVQQAFRLFSCWDYSTVRDDTRRCDVSDLNISCPPFVYVNQASCSFQLRENRLVPYHRYYLTHNWKQLHSKKNCGFKFGVRCCISFRGVCLASLCHLLCLHSWNICTSNLAFQLLLCIISSSSTERTKKTSPGDWKDPENGQHLRWMRGTYQLDNFAGLCDLCLIHRNSSS